MHMHYPQPVDKPVDNSATQRNVTSQYVAKALCASVSVFQRMARPDTPGHPRKAVRRELYGA
jgi:hypothetical protein